MWNLLLLFLVGPYGLWSPEEFRACRSQGGDRLAIARTSHRTVTWGEVRQAYGLYRGLMARDHPGEEASNLERFVRLYVTADQSDIAAEVDPSTSPDGDPIFSGSRLKGRGHRQSDRAASLTESVIESELRGGGGAAVLSPELISWTCYPLVDFISAWRLRNLVLTGRISESILRRGGYLKGTGTIKAVRMGLHPIGGNRDDRWVEELRPGQMSGPIREDGAYKLIRLDRREPGPAPDRETSPRAVQPPTAAEAEPEGALIRHRLLRKLGEREGWE